MTVTILTLYAGSELVSQPSVGVEFYYVLKGEGICTKGLGENLETMKLTTDNCMVVDPFMYVLDRQTVVEITVPVVSFKILTFRSCP